MVRFTIHSSVAALDDIIPVEAIQKIIREIKYKGDIEVAVETEKQTTNLISDHAFTRLCQNTFWRFLLCYVFQFWIVLWLLSRRWDVLTIEWPTRTSANDQETSHAATAWAERWKVAIARAAFENMRERIYSAEMSAPGVAWKALGDLDEVRVWGVGE